ncbi:MAG TPA: permease, partial [Anaerolineales bacterium]|nr:permease [Anaerolineales bacterium]
MINPEDEQAVEVIRRTAANPASSISDYVLGRPLPTADEANQTIGKVTGLAIFASDALSSSAYAIDEILIVLIIAGTGALSLSLPIAFVII